MIEEVHRKEDNVCLYKIEAKGKSLGFVRLLSIVVHTFLFYFIHKLFYFLTQCLKIVYLYLYFFIINTFLVLMIYLLPFYPIVTCFRELKTKVSVTVLVLVKLKKKVWEKYYSVFLFFQSLKKMKSLDNHKTGTKCKCKHTKYFLMQFLILELF